MRDMELARAGAPARGGSRSAYLWWLIWILWLPLFIPVAIHFVQAHPPLAQLVAGFVGAAAFFALYLTTSWRAAWRLASLSPRTPLTGAALWWPIAGMIALSVVLTQVNGLEWGDLFIYTSACTAGWLPLRQAATVIVGLLVYITIGLTLQSGIGTALSPVAFVGIVGCIVLALVQSVTTTQKLRAAQEEMARTTAVSEERLRIARDLHDLLGHNLSLIALKSELARRLLSEAPERAAEEIADVESVARKALLEVREAVTGYRQPSLASELAGAREILAAAGIVYRSEGEEDASTDLPSAIDAALAWAVREGITNVIRHSAARSCTLRVTRQAGEVCVEIRDDGVGARASGSQGVVVGRVGGNGLRGLAERVETLGGRFEAGGLAEGGFCLSVRLPVERDGQAAPNGVEAGRKAADVTPYPLP